MNKFDLEKKLIGFTASMIALSTGIENNEFLSIFVKSSEKLLTIITNLKNLISLISVRYSKLILI